MPQKTHSGLVQVVLAQIVFLDSAHSFSLQPQMRLMVALCNFANAFAPQKLGGMPYTVLIRTVYLVFMVSYHQHISSTGEGL